MFEDDLRTTASRKLDRVVVERSDLTLEPDSIGQEDGDFHSVIAKMLQEQVLKGRSALCGHYLFLL
jgi:DNA-binding FadR family transcriptional regulator